MENRKERRAAARKAARWEREAAARMEASGRSQRLKERILSAAHEDDSVEDPPIPGARLTSKAPAPQTDWMPLQAIAGLAAVGFPVYIVAEAALSSRLHPLHWLVAVAGGLLGYVGGLLLYRRRGY